MKSTVLVVWVCWWISQCLCNHDLPKLLEPNTRPHTWRPLLVNNTLLRRTSSRNGPHPALSVTPGTHNNTENISQIVQTINKTDKVHNGTSKHNSREHTVPSSVPLANTNTEDPRHSADKDFSTSVDSTTDKSNQEGPTKDIPSKHESHGEPSLSGRPAHDHKTVDITGNLPTPENFTASGRNEGEGREGHGRVTTGPQDLCSLSICLCNVIKKNVFCKHEHTGNNNRHELTLNHQVIPPSTQTLHIVGFEKVVIMNNTFFRDDLKLRSIQFEDIAYLELLSNSLHFSAKAEANMEVAVIFTNCNIPEIPQKTFTQQTRSEDTRVDINLEKTRFMALEIDGCNITSMRSYALYNARLNYFHLTRTKVEVMEENSIHLDSYGDWVIEKSQLPNMIQKSICLRAHGAVTFSHNIFLGLGNRSLDILSFSQVLFGFNNISHLWSEALLGIRPHNDARAANVVFLNNTIVKADERSLVTSKRYPMHERRIIGNKFNILCDCNVMMAFKKLLGIDNTSDYKDLAILKAVTQKSRCQVYVNISTYTEVERYVTQTRSCNLPITAIVAGTTVAVILLLLVVVCVVCTRRVKKARGEANYTREWWFSQSFSTLQSNPQLPTPLITGQPSQPWEPTTPIQPWVVAVPEVKTYKETELNVAYEHTEPMKVSLRDSFHPESGPLFDLQHRTQIRSSCPFN